VTQSIAASKAGRREWLGLAVLALPCLVYSMDLTVLNLALPHLTADLRPSPTQLLWIVDIYGFLLAGALITMGTLGDRIGRRRLLLIGATAFGLASLLAAFSNSAEMLVFSRAVLGLAAATLAPSTLSLIHNMFRDPRERTFAISVWIASFSAGGAIGPVVGGFMLAYFWWGSVFLIALPVMALLLIAGPFLLPEFRDPHAGRLDIVSAALSLCAILPVIYGVKVLADSGIALLPFAAILLGIAFGVLFCLRQLKLDEPLVDLSLFGNRAFSTALAINIIGFSTSFASFLFIAQYFQLVLGLSTVEAGIWSAPSGLGFVVSSLITARLTRIAGIPVVMALGLFVGGLSFLLLGYAGAERSLALMVISGLLLALGYGPAVTLTTDIIIGSVPPERAGVASGMAETSTELGGALGIATVGSLINFLYRRAMDAGTLADGSTIPLLARETLAGAQTIANGLTKADGTLLLETARTAFSGGFVVAALISAVGAGCAALVALRLPRPKPQMTPTASTH